MASLALYLSFFNAYVRTLLFNMFARLYPRQKPPLRNLRGQTAIITGANSGIGLYIAIDLAKQGATVCLACRSQERGDEAVKFIESQLRNDSNGAVNGEKTPTPGQVFCWKIDIGDMNSVRAFCERWAARSGANGNTLDMLVHNAGIPEAPVGSRRLNEKGLDTVYVTNVLGSIFMTHLIEPCLSPTARIVFTSSGGHYACPPEILFEPKPPMWLQSGSEHDPNANFLSKLIYKVKQTLGMRQSGMPIYAQTKAHQVILTTIFQEHFDKAPAPYNKRTAHAFAPGFTKSAIFGKFTMDWKTWITDPMYGFLKVTENFIATDTDQGAKTGGWLAAWGGQAGGMPGGAYWENLCKRTSLIDFERGKMGEDEFKKKVRAMWKVWEGDAGFSWDVGI